MELRILTPEESMTAEVQSVFLPGALGQFEVLKDHAPIVSALEKGAITWYDVQGVHSRMIESGFVTVKDNIITACVE